MTYYGPFRPKDIEINLSASMSRNRVEFDRKYGEENRGRSRRSPSYDKYLAYGSDSNNYTCYPRRSPPRKYDESSQRDFRDRRNPRRVMNGQGLCPSQHNYQGGPQDRYDSTGAPPGRNYFEPDFEPKPMEPPHQALLSRGGYQPQSDFPRPLGPPPQDQSLQGRYQQQEIFPQPASPLQYLQKPNNYGLPSFGGLVPPQPGNFILPPPNPHQNVFAPSMSFPQRPLQDEECFDGGPIDQRSSHRRSRSEPHRHRRGDAYLEVDNKGRFQTFRKEHHSDSEKRQMRKKEEKRERKESREYEERRRRKALKLLTKSVMNW